jgi:hypothetical protein
LPRFGAYDATLSGRDNICPLRQPLAEGDVFAGDFQEHDEQVIRIEADAFNDALVDGRMERQLFFPWNE